MIGFGVETSPMSGTMRAISGLQKRIPLVKTVTALVLIADDVADSDGYAYRLTGRTIQHKVPVTIEIKDRNQVSYGSIVRYRGRGYCNCVGYASLELRGDKLYALLEIPDNVEGKFQPVVESSGGEVEKRGDNELTIDPIILSIGLFAVGHNSDDRVPEIEL